MSNTSHFANRIRFLALSATVPNIRDFAEWLKEADGSPAEVRYVDVVSLARSLVTQVLRR